MEENSPCLERTVVVTLTDVGYFDRARVTVRDVRSRGQWTGDLVVISVGFCLNEAFRDFYGIIEMQFPRIDTEPLVQKIGTPFPGGDGREFTKRVQWEKLHVFDPYFQKWDRVIFLDAGLRILAPLSVFQSLDWRGRFLAHHDNGALNAPRRGNKPFGLQLCVRDDTTLDDLSETFPDDDMTTSQDYFLNCMWIYDTAILQRYQLKQEMMEIMDRFPIWKSNEMGVMNAILHFRHHLWTPFPLRDPILGKVLFEWSEMTQTPPGTWRDYCALKYPVTLSLHDT